MNIAVLGGGKEGTAVKNYFEKKGDHVQIFDKFEDSDIPGFKLEDYDKVFRSPSVHPQFVLPEEFRGNSTDWTSMTKYFFDNCKAKIIGVTGTKGKGTTCSFITSILRSVIRHSEWPSRRVFLVGNIGNPCIESLDEISEDDIVVFEMSSFQLWDLEKSPNVAVILRIGEDHLDRHLNLDDYVNAKGNIAKFQTVEDYCVYYSENEKSTELANKSAGTKVSYPVAKTDRIEEILNSVQIPGKHNKENAEAALQAVASFFRQDLNSFISDNNTFNAIKEGVVEFKGLPHRLQFVRELNGIKYYDDNYSSAFPATDVALRTFEDHPTILIAGGKDRHLDLTEMKSRFFSAKNLRKLILIGETKTLLAENEDPEKYEFADTLEEAVEKAKAAAETIEDQELSDFDLCIPRNDSERKEPIVLMSPGAASFDMFENFEDRGTKYQKIVNELK